MSPSVRSTTDGAIGNRIFPEPRKVFLPRYPLLADPMLQRLTRLASRYHSYRWWYVAASACVFIAVAAILSGVPRAFRVAIIFVGPALAMSWGMAVICFWFEPARGGLYGSVAIKHLPRMGQTVLRWFAAGFVVLWFAFGLVIWPVFALLI
jgi:hypothetical protein